MTLTRIALLTAVWAAVVLCTTPSIGAASPAANAPAPAPAGKPAEVSTVGTTAPVLTSAERLKLTRVEGERTARLARPGPAAKPAPTVPPAMLRPSSAFETRVPATGPRVRTKPIHSAREVEEREKGVRR